MLDKVEYQVGRDADKAINGVVNYFLFVQNRYYVSLGRSRLTLPSPKERVNFALLEPSPLERAG